VVCVVGPNRTDRNSSPSSPASPRTARVRMVRIRGPFLRRWCETSTSPLFAKLHVGR